MTSQKTIEGKTLREHSAEERRRQQEVAKARKEADELRELNIDGREVKDAKVVSNVTGIGWRKNSHQRWNKVINQIGTVVEDEIHQGKNHTTVTLKAGSQVIIDDIRGRINPQYRVRDKNGKIWFVSANNLEFVKILSYHTPLCFSISSWLSNTPVEI